MVVALANVGLWELAGSTTDDPSANQPNRKYLESSAIEGNSPVYDRLGNAARVPEYPGTRGTLGESTRTIS